MKEIVSSIYCKYPADKKTRPCLHPIVQLIGGEWCKADALKRDVSWATINLPNVIQLCRHQAQQNPGWNADLSAERLEKYVGDIPPNQLGYNSTPQESTLGDDGAFPVIIYLLKAYIQYVVNMADPPSTAGPVSVPAQMVQHAAASAHSAPAPAGPATTSQHAAAPAQSAPAPAGLTTTSRPAAGLVQPAPGPATPVDVTAPTHPPPPPPSPSQHSSCPACARRAPKGKEPVVVADAAPLQQAKTSGSLRGKKRSAPSPVLAGPEDQQSDANGDVDLPRVQVQHPSSPQQSSAAAGLPIVTARGDVSVIKIYFNHENLPHVQDRCGPCKEKDIEECKSQRKGRPTYACQACNKRKIPCHKPHPSWALPMLGVMKGVVHSWFY